MFNRHKSMNRNEDIEIIPEYEEDEDADDEDLVNLRENTEQQINLLGNHQQGSMNSMVSSSNLEEPDNI